MTVEEVLSSRVTSEPRWSIGRRLVGWYAGSVILLIVLTGGFLDRALGTLLDEQVDRSLSEKVHIVQRLLSATPVDLETVRHEVEEEWGHNEYAGVWLRVYDPHSSRVIAQTPGMPPFAVPSALPLPAPGADLGIPSAMSGPDGQPYRVMNARAPPTDFQVHAVLTFQRESELLYRYRRTLVLVLAVVAAATVPIGLLIARRGLATVGSMSDEVRNLSSVTLHKRLSLDGLPTELLDLAKVFNATLDRLHESFENLSRFSSNLAHELRTPLNNLRGEIEVTLSRPREPERYREVLESALEEGERLTDIVERMLFLARAEATVEPVESAPLQLAPALARVCEYYEAAAQESNVSITLEVSQDLIVPADSVLLNRAVANLMSNALDHTPAGGTIAITAQRRGEELEIAVRDTGCGVPAEHLPHIFERFHRVDPARTSHAGGVGLGLSIVRSIARLHGGRTEAASREGEGTTVRLILPLKPGA